MNLTTDAAFLARSVSMPPAPPPPSSFYPISSFAARFCCHQRCNYLSSKERCTRVVPRPPSLHYNFLLAPSLSRSSSFCVETAEKKRPPPSPLFEMNNGDSGRGRTDDGRGVRVHGLSVIWPGIHLYSRGAGRLGARSHGQVVGISCVMSRVLRDC